jgi:hypothetical protein
MAGESLLEKASPATLKLSCWSSLMATVTQPTIKAKYATVYDEPARIAKVNGALYVIYDDGRLEPFEVEMAPFTVVLGDCQMADVQAMWDRVSGGAAWICTHRAQGVS